MKSPCSKKHATHMSIKGSHGILPVSLPMGIE